ncbi:GyrI-like domain-containing protein [Flavisolibacter ginsenosidimutans]|uniref:GyrI-like domain-containing protein n=1 Tax=Flavisolibacter ginsenosidimutans TaxID=661481 RepID=A0A5B8UFP5_9BACT|nr:GyrI-like domain-containing protein [Flavisolibacter ginsenosidimutans]QEC55497.1 GyrI-like domain-containing protein [Flavisolibacter ginsenosidimutans]
MRKGIVYLLVFLLLFFGILYLVIPNRVSLNERADLTANEKAFARVFLNETNWPQWWPGEKERVQDASANFVYNDNKYTITARRFTSLVISIAHGEDSVSTELFLVPVRANRVELAWVGATNTGTSPLARIKKYAWAKKLSADLHLLLQRMQSFYANDEKLYGFQILETRVVDSLLVSTSTVTKEKPSTEVVYGLVDKLKAFVQKNNAKEISAPMLNVFKNDSTYLTRVAIPVDKALHNEGDIEFKRMLAKGNILTTDVKGGPWKVEKAFAEMENFANDNNRTAPAIPFQKLITDRRAEPDTSKWITKIYWPVM